jgi:NADPH:quinone reductase-like Zn-dependent oxidoreductase
VKKRPITLGHGVAGNIIKFSPDVTEAKLGDQICVFLGGHPDRLPTVIGLTMDGGYAEFALAAVEMIVLLLNDVYVE